MKNIVIISLVMLSACGGEDVFTWGEAAKRVSTAYCDAIYTCGFYGDDEEADAARRQCIGHTQFHLCELEGTCGEEIDAAVEAQVDVCVEDFGSADVDCYLLGYWGVIPESCGVVLDANPNNME